MKIFNKNKTPLSSPQSSFFLIIIVIIFISIITINFIGETYFIDPEAIIISASLITLILLTVFLITSQIFEKLHEANKIKDEMIRIVSHQLRSPLTNLKWICDSFVYKKENLEKEQVNDLLMMKENIEQMIKMTENLLIVSHVENKKFFIVKKEFYLEDLVREIIDKNHNSSKIKIKLNFDNNKNLIFTDPVQVRWIIKSLLDNAVRYIGYSDKEKEIEITIKKIDKNKIIFKIKDNGMGISKQDQENIFDKFFRGKKALKYNIYGTGLSLFACKSIIKELNGEINFQSQDEIGSTFWFTLPIN